MLLRFVSFAAVGLLASAIVGSVAAQPCTQYNAYNRAGAIARVRAPVVPYGTACSFHRGNFIYSWGCAGGLCAVSVDQQPFTVTVPTESLAFRRWRWSSNFFTFPQ
jgi:hypothetical protein